MNIVLVRLHTDTLETTSYSDNIYFYVYAAFFNVLLTYGMETSFFRFFSKAKEKGLVFTTAFTSIIISTFLLIGTAWFFNEELAAFFNLRVHYFNLLIAILALDTLVVIPFAYLRAQGRPFKYMFIKLTNLLIYVGLNFFFLWLIPTYKMEFPFFNSEDLVQYIFIANVVASLVTLFLLLPYFFKEKLRFSYSIFKQLLNYGWPIMVAGLAYVINENFDKWLIPEMISKEVNGAYGACYKIAVFMTLFIQGFRLGAEPFFFTHSEEKNAKQTYALIMKYFVVLGCLILVIITVYLDFFKELLVDNPIYWEAIDIVPVVLLANLFLGIYFNLAIWYKLTDRTKYGMYISVIGALITIAFNYIMIPKIGFMAAAWATLLAYLSMTLISYFLGRKYYPVPYALKSILAYLSIAVFIAFISYYKFDNDLWIGSSLLFIFLIIIYVMEKQTLMSLMRRNENKNHQ
ncbi:polysaccharide biosynthesis protein [Mesonia sp. K7]|nr:polysaccharide biosynthesis protein [Mesonia sp. K7]